MINFSDGELLDILPSQMKSDLDMQCLSHALKIAIQNLLSYESGTMTAIFIDQIPEKIVDVLAVDLRTQYYDQSLPLETKRNLVKNTLTWYMTAGTPAAVKELVASVFGKGDVVEWFEYGASPFYFKIQTDAILTNEIMEYFSEMIDRIKNVRSHLDFVEIDRTIPQTLYAGAGATFVYKPATIIDEQSQKEIGGMQDAAAI